VRRGGVGFGIALILLVPVFSLPAEGEEGAPIGACWAAIGTGSAGWPGVVVYNASGVNGSVVVQGDGTGSGNWPGVIVYNASGVNASVDLYPALRVGCPGRFDLPGSWLPTAPRVPAPFGLDYVSGDWVAPDVFRVTWRTNNPSMGRLWWGPSGGAVIGYLEDGAISEVHMAEVSGLEAGVTYSFQAAAIDRESAFVISIPLRTVAPTAPSPGPNAGIGAALATAAGAAVAIFRLRTAHRR